MSFQLNIADPGSSLCETIQKTEEHIEKAQNLAIQSKELVSIIQLDLKEVNDVRKKIKQYFEQLNILQCTHQYLRVIQHIEYLRQFMFTNLNTISIDNF